MKVTTELKNLIRRSFDEKRALVQRNAEEESTVKYNELIKKVESSKEFKNLVKAANTFRDAFSEYETGGRYNDDSNPWYTTSSFDNLKDILPTNLFANNVRTYIKYNEETMSSVRAKEKELDLAQESLMIKLTYEKDLDTIRAMLAEYDITI